MLRQRSLAIAAVLTYMTAFQLYLFSGSILWEGRLYFRAYFVLVGKMESLVLMAERWSIMSVLKCAFSPSSNPFATYVKERLSPSTKNTVTELWVIEFVS